MATSSSAGSTCRKPEWRRRTKARTGRPTGSNMWPARPNPKLAAIYAGQGGFAETPEQVGRTAFLVARTVATFGKATEGLETQGIAVCLAFHDAEPIFRIREVAPRGLSARTEDEGPVSELRYWTVSPRGNGMAYGPETVDQFAVPKPGEVVFTLREGQLTDYLFNTFAWRLCFRITDAVARGREGTGGRRRRD